MKAGRSVTASCLLGLPVGWMGSEVVPERELHAAGCLVAAEDGARYAEAAVRKLAGDGFGVEADGVGDVVDGPGEVQGPVFLDGERFAEARVQVEVAVAAEEVSFAGFAWVGQADGAAGADAVVDGGELVS